MPIRKAPRMGGPGWLQGAVLAIVVWGLSVLCAYAFEAWEPFFPRWAIEFDVPDTLGSVCSVIASPVAVGGWLLIWGDSGPPFKWLENRAFNASFAICFYALVGALIGFIFVRKWPKQFSAWRILILVTIAIVSIGCLPLIWEQVD